MDILLKIDLGLSEGDKCKYSAHCSTTPIRSKTMQSKKRNFFSLYVITAGKNLSSLDPNGGWQRDYTIPKCKEL